MDDRNATLLAGLDRTCPLIEIGPSFAPVAAKADGWATTVLDHAPRDELIAKYTHHPGVDVSRIEEVDIVWTGGPLHEAFPPAAQGRYRALVASHVIEHVPDVVAFFHSAETLLREDGVIALAVPDKRLCFDCLRPTTTTGQILSAARARRSRLTDASLFDAVAYDARPANGAPSWARETAGGPAPAMALEVAAAAVDGYTGLPDTPYVDAHAWVFTPASFALLVLELGALKIIDWRIETIVERQHMEFLVRLRRGREPFPTAAAREAKRTSLLHRMLLEIREQTDWAAGMPATSPASPRDALLDARLETMRASLEAANARLETMRAGLDAVNTRLETVDAMGTKLETVDARLDAMGARLETMEALLREVAETAILNRKALRPARALWRRMLPFRRVIAHARGRH